METEQPDLNVVSEKLLKALFQFRNVYKNENILRCRLECGSDDLRPSEIMLLFMLANATSSEGVNVSDLSRMLHVKPPSITPILTRLEAKKMIERKMDANDRRIVRVRLLAAGIKFVELRRSILLEHFKGLVSYLGIERSIELTSLINDAFLYFRQHMMNHRCGKQQRED